MTIKINCYPKDLQANTNALKYNLLFSLITMSLRGSIVVKL